MTATLSDHDLTTLVDAAARGVAESAAAWHGVPPWDEMDAMTQNNVREAALPFIFHGTKALAELGYVKPRLVATVDELIALEDPATVLVDYLENAYQWGIGLDGSEGWQSTRDPNPITSNHLWRFSPITIMRGGL
jgi:hypothetical protein